MKPSWMLGAALGALMAGTCFGATTKTISIYDGLSYEQLKAILSTTELGLTEQVTDKGNKYLTISTPSLKTSFVATVMSCQNGQASPCDGFTFLFIDRTGTMNSSQIGAYNREHHFTKISPANNHPLLNGEYYARGGVTESLVKSAGALYIVELSDFLVTSGAIAANAQLPPLAYAEAADSDPFFARLAQQPLTASSPPSLTRAEESLVDDLVARSR